MSLRILYSGNFFFASNNYLQKNFFCPTQLVSQAQPFTNRKGWACKTTTQYACRILAFPKLDPRYEKENTEVWSTIFMLMENDV